MNFLRRLDFGVTFRGVMKEAYIEQISVVISKKDTNETHELIATSFYEYRKSDHPLLRGPELAFVNNFTPILLSQNEIVTRIIRFDDQTTARKMKDKVIQAQEFSIGLAGKYEQNMDLIAKEFNEGDYSRELWNMAENEFYFKAGRYDGEIVADAGNVRFHRKFRFSISDRQQEHLQLNVVVMSTMHPRPQEVLYWPVYLDDFEQLDSSQSP